MNRVVETAHMNTEENTFIRLLMWPLQKFGDVVEFRRLRRRLPNVHRRLISTPEGVRAERDSEYFDRLIEVDLERYGD